MTKARVHVRLTKRTVEAAEKGEARYTLWDSDLKGFGLRVEPSGLKTFIVRYRAGGGRRGTLRQFKIGRFGKITAEQARAGAEKVLAQAELGGDPQESRQAERDTYTVSELCDLYLAVGVAAKKASTLALDRIRIERHIKPLIGARRITSLSVGDVEQMMNDIASGAKIRSDDNPHARGGRGAASRTVGLLSGIYIFAVNRRLAKDNPAKGVRRFKDGRRERFLSPRELGALGDALTLSAAQGASPSFIAILRLLALTGARKNEIAGLRWSEVDLDRSRLNLADSKTGRKVIPLGTDAVEILRSWPRGAGELVFPDPNHPKEPVRGLDWFWVGLRKRAGLEGLRIHDLRHSFASVGVASGQTLHLIGKLLGHANPSSTARYAHLADDPIKAAADTISGEVASALKVKLDGTERGESDTPAYVDAHLIADNFAPSNESVAKMEAFVADLQRRAVLPESADCESVMSVVVDAARQLRQLRADLGPGGRETRAAARAHLASVADRMRRLSNELVELVNIFGAPGSEGLPTMARRLLSYSYEREGGADPQGDGTQFDPIGWQNAGVAGRAMELVGYFEAVAPIVDGAVAAASRPGRERGSPDAIFTGILLNGWMDMRGAGGAPGPRKHIVEWVNLAYEVAGDTPQVNTTDLVNRLVQRTQPVPPI